MDLAIGDDVDGPRGFPLSEVRERQIPQGLTHGWNRRSKTSEGEKRNHPSSRLLTGETWWPAGEAVGRREPGPGDSACTSHEEHGGTVEGLSHPTARPRRTQPCV